MDSTAANARIEGALGFSRVSAVLADSDRLVASGTLDLSAVSTIDSAGISLLLELSRRAGEAGKSLRIAGAGPQIRSLAEFFKVDTLLQFAA